VAHSKHAARRMPTPPTPTPTLPRPPRLLLESEGWSLPLQEAERALITGYTAPHRRAGCSASRPSRRRSLETCCGRSLEVHYCSAPPDDRTLSMAGLYHTWRLIIGGVLLRCGFEEVRLPSPAEPELRCGRSPPPKRATLHLHLRISGLLGVSSRPAPPLVAGRRWRRSSSESPAMSAMPGRADRSGLASAAGNSRLPMHIHRSD
jgi:hypothetical protein